MYERNAIVIDRYFEKVYGYDNNNNIKNNSENYCNLVSSLEKYQEVCEVENEIMEEFEHIASRIRQTKKLQETLNKKNKKWHENREALFENLDEDSDALEKKFKKIEEEILKTNDQIRDNSQKFVEEIEEFNEKSETRSQCGKERKIIESEYQKILKQTVANFTNISKDKLIEIKRFIKAENKNAEKDQIKEKITKNGAKEKIPFDANVINTAIDVSTDIEEKKAEIFMSIYDKTMKLLEEIKNDSVEVEKHKKIVKDSKSKLEFLSVVSEYLVLFLDNERMNSIGGQEEHEKHMAEACEHLQTDLVEIQNMYTILIKEMTGKASNKLYKDLYNPEYLLNLQDDEKKFEQSISKLNMIGTVIYPDYWRIEGMQKIFDTFKHILINIYEKDLTEFEPLDIKFDVNEEELERVEEVKEEQEEQEDIEENEEQEEIEEDVVYEDNIEKDEEDDEEEEEFYWDEEDDEDELNFGTGYILDNNESKARNEKEKDSEETSRDQEIDKILGFLDDQDEEDEDDYEILDGLDDEEDDELTDDIFDDIEEEEENTKKKQEEKKKTIFGRRKIK